MATDSDDNTRVQAGATGDSMRTDAFSKDDGTIVKTPVVKVGVGGKHEAPRLVTETEPFPVFDKAIWLLLREILQTLQEILRELKRPRR